MALSESMELLVEEDDDEDDDKEDEEEKNCVAASTLSAPTITRVITSPFSSFTFNRCTPAADVSFSHPTVSIAVSTTDERQSLAISERSEKGGVGCSSSLQRLLASAAKPPSPAADFKVFSFSVMSNIAAA
jgi:hypothetical protein